LSIGQNPPCFSFNTGDTTNITLNCFLIAPNLLFFIPAGSKPSLPTPPPGAMLAGSLNNVPFIKRL
jgi:hypothetical protein